MAKQDKSKKVDPYYRGEPTPKHLKDGPTHDRRCTDFLCLIIFLGFWFGMGSIGIYAISKGDPVAMTLPYDQYDNQCGTANGAMNLTGYPYLYFIQDDSDFDATNTVCVRDCPEDSDAIIKCSPDMDDCSDVDAYSTSIFANRICLPTDSDALATLYNTSALESGLFFKAASDLQVAWWMILVVGAFTLVLGFLYLILMKYFAGILIWGVLISFIILTAASGSICLADALGTISIDDLANVGPDELYIIAVVSYLICLVSIVITCICRTRINLSIAVLKCATDFIEDTRSVLFVPFVFFFKSMIFYIGWVLIFLYIIGTNTSVPDGDHYPIGDIDWNPRSLGMMVYYLFALFWNHAFGVALSQFIIASATCLWYFKLGKSNVNPSPIWTSVKRSILHLGSIAFGSLIVAMLDMIRTILNYLNKKINSQPEGEAKPKGFCASCCGCCLGFFEKFLKFVNRHAYIQIAMTGEGFCKATEDAFHLLLRNAVRFGMVHGLATIFLFFGQLLVSISATLLGYLIISNVDYFTDNLMSPIVPSIFFFLSSYMIAHIFMSIYGVSADTIIHCFAMDEEINDGVAEHAPKDLREFVDNHLHKKLMTDDSIPGSSLNEDEL